MPLLGRTVISLDGELALDDTPLACPKCGTTTLTALMAPRKRGEPPTLACAGKKGHAWPEPRLPADAVSSLKAAPGGAFALQLPTGEKLTGQVKATAQKPTGKGKPVAGPVKHSAAVEAVAAAQGRVGAGGGGALAAAFNAVAAVAGAAGQAAGAVGQVAGAAASTANAASRLGTETIGLARDGVKVAGQALAQRKPRRKPAQ